MAVQLLNATGAVIATATTDASGHYGFTGLQAGTYSVHFQPVAGFTFSAYPSGSTGPITLATGQAYLDADIGLYQGASCLLSTTLGSTGNGWGGEVKMGNRSLRSFFYRYHPCSWERPLPPSLGLLPLGLSLQARAWATPPSRIATATACRMRVHRLVPWVMLLWRWHRMITNCFILLIQRSGYLPGAQCLHVPREFLCSWTSMPCKCDAKHAKVSASSE